MTFVCSVVYVRAQRRYIGLYLALVEDSGDPVILKALFVPLMTTHLQTTKYNNISHYRLAFLSSN